MLRRFARHLRGNFVGYVALFAALGGTSYAAVSLRAGSVTTRALANGAVTNAKLAKHSVGAANVKLHSLTAAAFQPGAIVAAINGKNGTNGKDGINGITGPAGPAGPTGPQGPAGHDGSASIAMTATQTGGAVTAPHGTSTNIPLTGASWTQAGNDLDLVTGSVTIETPASCTGSFGNSLLVNVDGTANTFALAPTAPASSTVHVPFLVSELTQPGSDTNHTITAALANTCSQSGEDYTVSNVKVDVVNFH
jgi:Collagen triple helix repeat (20 copies)